MPRTREAGLIVALLLVGAALRAWEYFGGASLWLNELAVARNVLDRSALDLVSRPLDYDQSAPPAYLLATKLATVLLGDGELAFRLPPFLAGLAALALFPLLARRLLEPRAALVATALAALAVPLVQYGAEAKQYGVDVLGTIIVILIAARWRQHPTAANAGIAALAGLAVVWFSNAAVLVLVGAGAGLAAGFLLERQFGPWRQLAAIALAWAAAAGAATLFARHMMSEGAHGWFLRFWRSGFPPDSLAAWPGWLARHLERLFGSELGYPAPWLVVVLAVVGVVALARRPPVAFLVVTPIVVTLAAAAFRKYPFGGRLTLFLLPLFLLVIAAGVDAALRPLPPRLPRPASSSSWRWRPVRPGDSIRCSAGRTCGRRSHTCGHNGAPAIGSMSTGGPGKPRASMRLATAFTRPIWCSETAMSAGRGSCWPNSTSCVAGSASGCSPPIPWPRSPNKRSSPATTTRSAFGTTRCWWRRRPFRRARPRLGEDADRHPPPL